MEKLADSHVSEMRVWNEQLKAAATRQEVRAARQAAYELQRRQMITARDLKHQEANLQKIRQMRNRMLIEQKIHDDEMSELEKVEVTAKLVK